MRRVSRRTALVLAILLLVAVVLGCASPGAPQAARAPVARAAPADAGVFKTAALTINPLEANPGVQVMITAKVTNTASAESTYTPKLRIDSLGRESLPTYLYLKNTAISPGATQQLSFVVATDNPGKYKVTWGELAGEFAVVESTDSGNSTSGTAPDFTGVDVVTGKKVTLSQFKGSVVLFNFVNYGCDPSVNNVVSAQLLAIKELQKQRKDFVPVSVFCGCCPPEVLRNFAKQNDLSWPWILDSDNSIARKYMTYLRKYGYPTLVFIDGEQRVSAVAGYSDLKTLSTKIDEILGKGPVR